MGPRCEWPRAGHGAAQPQEGAQRPSLVQPVLEAKEESSKVDLSANDIAWGRRLMATTVCIALINERLISSGGSPLSDPLSSGYVREEKVPARLAQQV